MDKTLVLGIGNTIRGDDAVGILAARALKDKINSPELDIKESHESGLDLLDIITGYKRVIIIDSIHTGRKKPGEIYKFTKENLKAGKELYSSHQIGLGTILDMAHRFKIDVPQEITVYAVEIDIADSFKEGLTEKIRKVLSRITDLVRKDLFERSGIWQCKS